MFEFLHSEDLLEHVVELLFGKGLLAVQALVLGLLLLGSRPASARPS